jgi:hypothetical protein
MKIAWFAVATAIAVSTAYVMHTRDNHYSQDIEKWNSTTKKTYVVSEVVRRTKELNRNKDGQEINKFLTAVSSGLATDELNAKDKERLCRLYKRFSVSEAYSECQNDIIQNGYRQNDVKAWVRSAKTQLKINASGRGSGTLKTRVKAKFNSWWQGIDPYSNDSILSALSSIDASILDQHDRYEIAKTQLLYRFNEADAVDDLRSIIENSNNDQLVSRSYFVLARYFLERDDLAAAGQLYTEYTELFGVKPGYAFFVNKANQRRLQIQLASGDAPEIYRAKEDLIAFVGETEDLRVSFDTARKLAEAGHNRDALGVYIDGVKRLESSELDKLPLYRRIRLYVEVVRSGNAIGVGYDIQNRYIQLVDQKLEYGLSEDLQNSDELSYLYSQALLWAAEAYTIHEQYRLAENFYGRFLKQFPESPDYEFALYKFLSICSEIRKCYADQTIHVLVPVGNGQREEQDLGDFSALAKHIRNTAWKGEVQKWLDSAG